MLTDPELISSNCPVISINQQWFKKKKRSKNVKILLAHLWLSICIFLFVHILIKHTFCNCSNSWQYSFKYQMNPPPGAETMTSLQETFSSRKKKFSVDFLLELLVCMAPLKLVRWLATPLSSLHRSLAVMLLPFEVCEVCCVCHSHANQGDNPSHLFSETSVHGLRLYSGIAQLPHLALILKGLEDSKEAIFRGLLDMLVETLCSLMNIGFSTGAG